MYYCTLFIHLLNVCPDYHSHLLVSSKINKFPLLQIMKFPQTGNVDPELVLRISESELVLRISEIDPNVMYSLWLDLVTQRYDMCCAQSMITPGCHVIFLNFEPDL